MKRILFLLLDTGTGHLAAARAIAAALEQNHRQAVRSRIVDLSQETRALPLRRSHETYQWFAREALWLYRWLWRRDRSLMRPELFAWLCRLLAGGTLAEIYRSERPDLVVSVHGFLNHYPERLLRKAMPNGIPFVTVVTDMVTLHRVWINPRVDWCIVPTEMARLSALGRGMPPERLEVLGLPVDPRFSVSMGTKPQVRRRLGLDPTRRCVLIVSGGGGFGPMLETAREVASQVSGAQLIVVAGRNPNLQRRLLSASWPIPTRIYGFTENMAELMRASDVLVTKAGPGTLAEAFIVGLPVIVSSYVPGQETGNAQYVAESGAGAYVSDPEEIGRTVQEWLGDPDRLRMLSTRSAKMGRPEASRRIAERLRNLAGAER